MIRFLTFLILTLVLATIWVVTALTFQISGQDYLQLTAPWWHMVLQVGWLVAAFVTSMVGIAHFVDWQSRRKLSHNPP